MTNALEKNNFGSIRLNRIMAFIVGLAINFDYFSIGGGLSIVSLIIVVYFFLVFSSFKTKVFMKNDYEYIWPPIIYLFLLIILNILNLNLVRSSILPVSFVFCLLLFFVVFLHVKKDSKAINYFVNGVAFGGVVMAICYTLGIGVEFELYSNRLTMFGSNSNNLGCLMCITIAIVLYNYIIKDFFHIRSLRYLFVFLLIPMVLVIFATASRTAFLTLVLVVSLSFLLVPTKKKVTKLLLICILALVAYVGYKSLEDYVTLYDRLFLMAEREDYSSGRDERWGQLFSIAIQNPFGLGQTGYAEVAKPLYGSPEIDGQASPHNVFLEVALYTGFLGLFLMSFFWFNLFKKAWRYIKEYKDLLFFLIMVVFFTQMLFGQILIFRVAWLFFGIIAGSTQNRTKIQRMV